MNEDDLDHDLTKASQSTQSGNDFSLGFARRTLPIALPWGLDMFLRLQTTKHWCRRSVHYADGGPKLYRSVRRGRPPRYGARRLPICTVADVDFLRSMSSFALGENGHVAHLTKRASERCFERPHCGASIRQRVSPSRRKRPRGSASGSRGQSEIASELRSIFGRTYIPLPDWIMSRGVGPNMR